MMLLDTFLYDFVAEHQRTLREAAGDARRGGALVPGCWRPRLRVPAVVASRTVPSVRSRRVICRRRLACGHASGDVLIGHDV
jgi:hypothetical protein